MNPMNFGGEFKTPPDRSQRRVNWMPVTPEKPIHGSDPGNQFPSDEWQQLTGMYGALIQEPANFDGGALNFDQIGAIQNVGRYSSNGDLAERSRVLNNIAGSYAHAFSNDRPSWSDNSTFANLMLARNTASMEQMGRTHRGAAMVNTTLRSANMAGTQLIPDLHFQADSSWRRPYASGSALANDVNSWLSSNQMGTCNSNSNNWLSSNQLGSCNGLSQIPTDGFPLPYRPNYNLNLPPRTETDSITSIRNSVQIPATPQNEANRFDNGQFSAGLNLLMDESSSRGKSLQNFVPTAENEAIRNTCNELQNIVDSSSTAISTPLKDNKELEKVGDQNIDLNKTPQQKAPKRKKIRPKVVIEGKPKRVLKSTGQNMDKQENRTAKRKYVRKATLQQSESQQADMMKSPIPPTPANTDSNQKTGKRKYVRKKGVTEAATQQADNASSSVDPDAETATKSCRRGLNFDVEKSCDGDEDEIRGQEEAQQNTRSFNLNLESPATELHAGINSCIGTRPAGQNGHHDGTRTSNLTPSMDNVLARFISLQGRRAAGTPQASMNGDLHMRYSTVSSKDIDARNADPWQKRNECGYTPRQQNIYTEGIGQVVFQAKTTNENNETTRQLMSQCRAQQLLNTFPHFPEARVSKRGYQQMVQQEECYRGTDVSGSHKKTKFENGLFGNVYGMPFVKALEVPREASTRCTNEIGTSSFTSQVNHEILNSYLKNCKPPNKPSGVNYFPGDLHSNCMAAGKTMPLRHTHGLHSYKDRMGNINGVTQVQNLASMIATESHNPCPSAPPRKDSAPRKGQVKRTYQATAPADQQQIGSWKRQSPMQSKGPADPQQHPTQIEEIIDRFEGLNLKEADSTMAGQQQKAIVIYQRDGAIVLHEPKKRKPRPKVDLDPETNRIWKLLMGNEGSEGIEGKDKEKWWEGEREVFRGRADSFIARMHLVQGDRRFSPWKGSVVDSVVGVFLTQNVSDHLSSSAFMCLAACFPCSKSNEAYESNGKNILVEEPEDCVVNIDDSIKSLEKISCLPVCNSSSITPLELTEQRRGSEASGTERTSFTEVQSRSIEEEVISSQGSYDSSVVQDNGGIRSSSGSNSEAEDPRNGSIYKRNSDSTPTSFQEMEKTTVFLECCSHISESSIFDERFSYQSKQLEHMEGGTTRSRLDIGNLKDSESTYPITSQDPEIRVPVSLSNNCLSHMAPEFGAHEYIGMLHDKRTSPWSSTSSEFIKAKDPSCIRNSIAENVSDTNIHHKEQLRSQGPTMDTFEFSSSHPTQQSISQSQPPAAYDQLLTNSYPSVGNKSYQLENTSVAEPVKHAESVPNLKNDNMHSVSNVSKQVKNTLVEESVPMMKRQEQTENKLVKPKPKEQVHSSGKAANEMNTKAKKVKAQNEGKKASDWDSLRRHAQATGKKERSKNAMDTMDYEAMRCANVREISDAIKERGMNNMLAERIQDFLNRVVNDHGSIDLEWLRDVPADKAKEYLLSIRGLGLKSVECVRLLTLHQLAFPVDTNVGRIAVRLGWVPLQPLPESLQLHLLEMYPMLESIQKYLWPRLCKLDQRTLYELHYQMITFGKVFCTKNKPNCNACPMKGECRHFASAFASARLALPGPEEKSIISSTFPTAQENNPTAVINPMPLLKEAGPDTGKCNPIIEEPATPEEERTELSETDIEDMFDEDPDEIPTIKLNIETFTENLQKYMNDNMELQEGDMSKALVALNPEAAAIPTPKLKNVSRLRTEHQVYELPDSHPLLTEMERREPDDPSPYLLAIWTPGETADSVEPAEIKCSFQDSGKLCNDKTCFSCNSTRETNSQTVRGTILIPCRTAMRGSFPLNGTYFQVNEMFADHDSSINPIDVPRAWIWNLPRRTVYFGTSVSTIFKGLSTEGIQYCFWRGFVCVRGFDQKSRAPRPLSSRLHYPASRLTKQ